LQHNRYCCSICFGVIPHGESKKPYRDILLTNMQKYVDFEHVFQETMYRVKMMVSAIQDAFIDAFFTTYSRLEEFLYYHWITFKLELQKALREFLRE
jgi:hypothetical protein